MRKVPDAKADRLAALRKRQESLRLVILDEVAKQQKRQERQHKKLVDIVGTALIAHAERTQGFKVMLQQVLSSADVDERSRAFLRDHGWLGNSAN